jgi:hypothetical protein
LAFSSLQDAQTLGMADLALSFARSLRSQERASSVFSSLVDYWAVFFSEGRSFVRVNSMVWLDREEGPSTI